MMSVAFTMGAKERVRALSGRPKLRALEKQVVSWLY